MGWGWARVYGGGVGFSRADLIVVARLHGVALRYAGGFSGTAYDEAAAVAALRTESRDRRLLTRAAANAIVDDEPGRGARTARLLELAGADLEQARVWRAANPPRGFRPPQADPTRNRSS